MMEKYLVKSNTQLPFIKINPIDGAEMVWVPEGTFIMGSPDYIDGAGTEDEHPAHQVTLSGFWIYKYEVTVAQYSTFCLMTSHELPRFPDGDSWEGKSGWDDPSLQQHPIVNVNWYDCETYTNWAGVSLPTEAQWEYAARGPQGRNYPWGGIATKNDLCNGWDKSKCSNDENSSTQGISTWPVGSFPTGVSWCGTQDMAGNVWEWCSDWDGNYSSMPATNPTGPISGEYRILRGGCWASYDGTIRVTNRHSCPPDEFVNGFGFRCATNSSR